MIAEFLDYHICTHILRRTYDKASGILYDYRGDPSGYPHLSSTDTSGRELWYMRVNLGRYGQHYVHRLAFLLVTGEWPNIVDHIDHDGLNNEWTNLRDVNHSQNGWNMRVPLDHKTGKRGVYYSEKFPKSPWTAELRAPGYRLYRRFATFEEALEARLEAERAYWVY